MNKVATMPVERYELVGGNSKKFWEVSIDNNALTLHWGRISTNGQHQRKIFLSSEEAEFAKEMLVREKLKKGYRLVGNVEKKIIAVKQLDPEHAENEAFFMAELLSWYLKNKLTAKQVASELEKFEEALGDPYGSCDENKEGEAEMDDVKILCKILKPFDVRKAVATGKKRFFDSPPDLEELLGMFGNDWIDFYKTGIKNDADHFMIYDEETGYVSLAIVAGPVTQEDLVEYNDN